MFAPAILRPVALAAALLYGVMALGAEPQAGLPPGWFFAGSAPHQYETGVDTVRPCEGERSAFVRSRAGSLVGNGTFMQMFLADDFRGQRVRFSAAVRTESVEGWAGLWMRVDGPDSERVLAFDNMQSRPLSGTLGCARYDVVLDVPREATRIALGVLLSGKGAIWMGGVRFEPVDKNVSTTDLVGATIETLRVPRPENLVLAQTPVWGSAGRVGEVWFDPVRVDGPLRLIRSENGQWAGPWGEVRADGNHVTGKFSSMEGDFTVTREGNATLVSGTWGGKPLRVALSADRLSMSWSGRSRELVRDVRETPTMPGCTRYVRTDGGLFPIDELEVCGAALHEQPPPAQLVIGLLSSGFRRNPKLPSPVPPPSYGHEGRSRLGE